MSSRADRHDLARWAAFALAALCLALIVRVAWVCDDAFITLRTVDNFVHGRGLVWNADERVQSYTHPLWMFVLSAAYAVTREPFVTTAVVSIAFSALFLLLFLRLHGRDAASAALALLALVTSMAFVEYSTSGLENPLTHVILCVFCAVFLDRSSGPRQLLLLATLAALGMLNRLDALLLFLPAMAVAARASARAAGLLRSAAALALGFLPLVVWEAFSLFYYGSLVPNTAYAKLTAGIPLADYVEHGLRYALTCALMDPATPFVIAWALVATLLPGGRRLLPISAGIVLTLCYGLRIGGDFMAGRLFAAPLVLAAIVVARNPLASSRARIAFAVATLALGFVSPYSCLRFPTYEKLGRKLRPERAFAAGTVNERVFYMTHNDLFGADAQPSEHPWALRGKEFATRPEQAVYIGVVGMLGYYAGPAVRIIDRLALCDPLLARLPTNKGEHWRTGHLPRSLPAGYVATRESGLNRIEDPHLAAYYDRLRFVISGELWSTERLRAALALASGRFDPWLEAYVAEHPPTPDAGEGEGEGD